MEECEARRWVSDHSHGYAHSQSVRGKAFKLRESPKASPTTLFSKGKLGNEGNDLK
jgi:hypothetical protein